MTSASTATEQLYRPHTLNEFPQFTAQEMGQRVLALIDSLKTYDDLTLQRIREVTGFPMERVVGSGVVDYSFTMHMPDSGWYYGFDYEQDKITPGKSAWLDFVNQIGNEIRHDVSMTPVCLDFHTYVAALERMGFEKKFSDYQAHGGVLTTLYERNSLNVQVRERREADQPEVKSRHICLQYLGFGFARPE